MRPALPAKSGRSGANAGLAGQAAQAGLPSYTRDNGAYNVKRARKGRKRKVALCVVLALVLIVGGAGTAFAVYIGSVNAKLNTGTKTQEEVMKIEDELRPTSSFTEPFYMMLIGSDRREGDDSMGARSDTNIVARIDPVNNQVTMVSIPRDTKINIPGYGTNKFNAAYNYDGAAGAIREASELLGIEISHYAEVNFEELVSLVDAVGGVDIYVDEYINDPDADNTSWNPNAEKVILEVGEHHLNGTQALAFARSRAFADGDFTRTRHQRQLIEAIVDEVLSMNITKLPAVIESASSCVTTDLSLTDIITLAQQFKSDNNLVIYSAMLPSSTTMIGDVSYVINDTYATQELMKIVESGADPSTYGQEEIAEDETAATGASAGAGGTAGTGGATTGTAAAY